MKHTLKRRRKAFRKWALPNQRTEAQQTHHCVQHQRIGMKPRYQTIKLKAK